MGKKNANPAEAFRKAQKAKELKKNKEDRKKKREDRTAKQDTRSLETEIRELTNRKLDDAGKERLSSLQSELKYVNKLKEKYVAKNPDARDRIYHTERRGRRPDEEGDGDAPPTGAGASGPGAHAHLYNPDGTLRDPKRSVYYDATYNPFGVPPPGMPYRERSEEESDSSDDDEDDSDDDIVMPDGKPPGGSDSDADSDDSMDIPMPEGPPPGRPPPVPPLPPMPMPMGGMPGMPGMPMRPMGMRPPMHFPQRPPPQSQQVGWGHLMPHPPGPGGVPGGGPPRRPPGAAGGAACPPRPNLPLPPPSLPAKPGSMPAAGGGGGGGGGGASEGRAARPTEKGAPGAPPPAGATISAEPQLRDLRKEATVFVPRGVKKARTGPVGLARVNAAPDAGKVDAEGDVIRERGPTGPSLVSKLGDILGPAPPAHAPKDTAEDDYERFLEGLE